MKIKVLKRSNKKLKEFETEEWKGADKEHYGRNIDWHPKEFYLAAIEKGEILGSLNFRIQVGVAEIKTLIVARTKQGRGIGKALVQKAEEIARKNNAHKLYLISGKGWDAVEFYKKLGFENTGESLHHYAKHDFLHLTKFI